MATRHPHWSEKKSDKPRVGSSMGARPCCNGPSSASGYRAVSSTSVPTSARSPARPAKASKDVSSPSKSRSDVEAELRAWQQAKRDRLEKERVEKAASRPRFDPTPSKPKNSRNSILGHQYSFGQAGKLLRQAHGNRPPARSPCTVAVAPNAARPVSRIAESPRQRPAPRSLWQSQEAMPCMRLNVLSMQSSPRNSVKPAGDHEFLEVCLGGPDAVFELEVDRQEQMDKENVELIERSNLQPSSPSRDSAIDSKFKSMDQDDSDCEPSGGSNGDDDDVDIEDMFAFDPEIVADLVKSGMSMARLTEHLQSAYVDALERRLLKSKGDSSDSAPSSQGVDAEPSQSSTPRPELQADNVSQHMTPERTPREDCDQDASSSHLMTFAGNALVEAVFVAQQRSRRSAALRHRPSALKREHCAVNAVEAYCTRSLLRAESASTQERELLEGAVQSVVKTASKRHRRSLDKAVEVLEHVAESTNEPLENWSEDKVETTVDLIQEAMDEAIKRHRRSIADAVQAIGAPRTIRFEDEVQDTDSLEARVQRAVSTAYSHRKERDEQMACGQ